MRATMLIQLAGNPMVEIGDEVSGDDAIRLVEAGYATPIVETETVEKAVKRKPVSKETR